MINTAERITLAVFDPDEISRAGCKSIFESDGRFHVAAEAPYVSSLVKSTLLPKFDVVVIDPVVDGQLDDAQVKAALARFPVARTLLLTDSVDLSVYLNALDWGIRGLLPKGRTPSWLLLQVTHIITSSNAIVIDRSILLRMKIANVTFGLGASSVPLSARETEIAQLLGEGLTDDEVARALGIARATVHTHVSSIMRKVPASNRVQLGIHLLSAGIIRRTRPEEPLRKAS